MPRPNKPLPLVGTPTPEDFKRFWEKVKFTDTCWVWLGHKVPTGYGVFHLYGKNRKAHRVARHFLQLDLGNHLTVDHTCRNRSCVNPAHTEMVTQTENTYRGQSPWMKNKAKTHCVNGHEFTPENTAMAPHQKKKGRKGERTAGRVCLTCYPRTWLWAIVERAPPPQARTTWRGPFRPDSQSSGTR